MVNKSFIGWYLSQLYGQFISLAFVIMIVLAALTFFNGMTPVGVVLSIMLVILLFTFGEDYKRWRAIRRNEEDKIIKTLGED